MNKVNNLIKQTDILVQYLDKKSFPECAKEVEILRLALNKQVKLTKLYRQTLESDLNTAEKQIQLDEIDSELLKSCLEQEDIIKSLYKNHDIDFN